VKIKAHNIPFVLILIASIYVSCQTGSKTQSNDIFVNDTIVVNLPLLQIQDSILYPYLDSIIDYTNSKCAASVDTSRCFYYYSLINSRNNDPSVFTVRYENYCTVIRTNPQTGIIHGVFYYKDKLFVVFKSINEIYPFSMKLTKESVQVAFTKAGCVENYSMGSIEILNNRYHLILSCEKDETPYNK